MSGERDAILQVEHLSTVFDLAGGAAAAVSDVTFSISKRETLCLVGESGSGKSLTAMSILGLVQPPGRVAGGRVLFEGRDLLALSEPELRKVRGPGIGLVFQEPTSALNPVFSIGGQIAETLAVHGIARGRAARQRAIEILDAVSIPDAARRVDDYPYQLSGGLRQRAMIALALCCNPSLIIADEPTTALDVTIQAQILELLRALQQRLALGLLLITHDLGIVAEMADRVAVMYAGRIVEQGGVHDVFQDARHPYTRGLLASVPGNASLGRLQPIPGAVPALAAMPPGCPFHPRCAQRFEPCDAAVPGISRAGSSRLQPGEHTVRCFLNSPAVNR